MFEKEKYGPLKTRTFIAGGALALTYLTSRDDNHSKVHKDLANLALGAEIATVISGFRQDKLSRTIGMVGIGITTLCFAVVALTDRPFINYLQSGKALTREGITNLGRDLFEDTKRHIIGIGI